MNITCPNCGTYGALTLFAADADARRVVALAAKLPPLLERSLFAYLQLFAPPQRKQTWSRLHTLLAELLPMIDAQTVQRHGRPWPAPHAAWMAAMDEIVSRREQLTLPLKSHGYLLEIVASLANRAEAQLEARTEDQRRSRRAPDAEPLAADAPRALSAVVARSLIAAENKVRARMGQPPMTAAEEAEFVTNLHNRRST